MSGQKNFEFVMLNPLPHKSGETSLFLAPLDFQGGKGGLMSKIKNPKAVSPEI
jgi:hypothetical protein